jgi:hypothetical protein
MSMAIAASAAATKLTMSFLPAWKVPSVIHKTWTPPATTTTSASLPGASAASSSATDPLVQGSRDAAKKAFLFGLKIAFNDADREAMAKQYLASTRDYTAAEKAADPSYQSLSALAQSIVSRTKNNAPSAFLSTYS